MPRSAARFSLSIAGNKTPPEIKVESIEAELRRTISIARLCAAEISRNQSPEGGPQEAPKGAKKGRLFLCLLALFAANLPSKPKLRQAADKGAGINHGDTETQRTNRIHLPVFSVPLCLCGSKSF